MNARIVGSGALTDGDRERIDDMAGRGFKAGRIAQHLGRHPSTVNWYMYSQGLAAPKQTNKPKVYVRNGRTVRGFSGEEDAFIQALRIQSYKLREIAEYCNKRFGTERTAHTVKCRLIMLAAVEDLGDRTDRCPECKGPIGQLSEVHEVDCAIGKRPGGSRGKS